MVYQAFASDDYSEVTLFSKFIHYVGMWFTTLLKLWSKLQINVKNLLRVRKLCRKRSLTNIRHFDIKRCRRFSFHLWSKWIEQLLAMSGNLSTMGFSINLIWCFYMYIYLYIIIIAWLQTCWNMSSRRSKQEYHSMVQNLFTDI